MDWTQGLLAVFLGLSLAASTGLNTFLPLFALGLAARFHLGGVALAGSFSWLDTNVALIALGVATLAEIIADKVPAIDHALDTLGTFVRPIVGSAAFAAALGHMDPAPAALIGLIIGAPIAFGVHSAKAATRVTSSAATLGCANPVLSTAEDAAAVSLSLTGIFIPILVPVVLAAIVAALLAIGRAIKRRMKTPSA